MGLKKLALIAAFAALLVVGGIVAAASTGPDAYKIERSVVISAPQARVYEWVGSARQWEAWSPWKARDPSIVSSYQGPESGVGASWTWTSKSSGSGRMTFTTASVESGVQYRLVFVDFNAESDGSLALVPAGTGTRATWTMTGTNGLKDKVVWLVFGMESALGADFEDGLTRLKALAEAGPPSAQPPTPPAP